MAAGKTVLVSLMALALGASTAHAEPLTMEFTEGRANVGADQLSVTNDDDVLFKAPATALFKAEIDPESGEITDGFLTVPAFQTVVDNPPDTEVTVEFEIGPIAGTFDRATGFLTGSGTAGGTLSADGSNCNVATVTGAPNPAVLTLSTSGSTGGPSPLLGTPFAAGLTGPGSVAGQWTDMTATPSGPGDSPTVCSQVAASISGPGGIWLQQAGDSTPPAAPWLSTDPASPNASAPRIRGVAEAGSTVKLYAGPGCVGTLVATASAAELGSPGISVAVAEGVTAFFSATATDAAGNVSACSAQVSYTRRKASTPPGTQDVDPPVVKPGCVVPKLAGKSLKQAKRALKTANCKLGEVTKPKKRKGQKKLPALVVKRSTPGRGAKPADRKVELKLGPKPKKPKPRR